MRTIAISGLVALATVLGGVAIPATAMAQPTSGLTRRRPSPRAWPARPGRPPRAGIFGGEPKISCVSTTDCLAVEGTSSLSEDGSAVPIRVARWNGKSWKGVGVALPKGTKSADLEAVSCKSATSCLVVGDYYKSTSGSAPNYPLALIYNGTSLKPTAAAVPLPKGATDVTLADVSCATTRYCVAIGAAGPTPGTTSPTPARSSSSRRGTAQVDAALHRVFGQGSGRAQRGLVRDGRVLRLVAGASTAISGTDNYP